MKVVGLLGAGSQARELSAYLSRQKQEIIFYAVSAEYTDIKIDDAEVIDISHPSADKLGVPVIAAAGAPQNKKALIELWGGENFHQYIDDSAWLGDDAKVGLGSIIAPGAVITTNVKIGKHVLVNVGATISHDVVIDDFATISPGVNLGGGVHIGAGAFIGIGASVLNRVKVAEGVVVGAGAVVTKDADQPNGVYVGVPAKLIRTNDSWLDEL